MVSFFVPGHPISKGSMRAFKLPNGAVISTASNASSLKPWEATIRSIAAKEISGFLPPENAIRIELSFYLQRPKGHFKKSGEVSEKAPRFPAKKPDVDKLCRSVLDALTGIAYHDDAQVTKLEAVKLFAVGTGPGVHVTVEELSA